MGRRVAVIGAGWAGLAAAVDLALAGAEVTVFEASPTAGGRARSVTYRGQTLDCGQHILLGAYGCTQALMRRVGVDVEQVLQRHPLVLQDFQGQGLNLGQANRRWGSLFFALSVLNQSQWSVASRWALLTWSVAQQWRGFRCDVSLTVDQLLAPLPSEIVDSFLAPLCLAALNTPVQLASAEVFLRVLRDALFAGRGSSDLLLPAAPLSALLNDAALSFLTARGSKVLLGHRVETVTRDRDAWHVSGEAFDAVILATPPKESARLTTQIAPTWSDRAERLQFEAISTLYLHDPLAMRWAQTWHCPMRALHGKPAQYVFKLQSLQGATAQGMWSLVASAPSVDLLGDRVAFQEDLLQQWLANWEQAGFVRGPLDPAPRVVAHLTEKRATFSCTPGLVRPDLQVTTGCWAAGDYVAGPYPSTLEGAVLSGQAAAQQCQTYLQE